MHHTEKQNPPKAFYREEVIKNLKEINGPIDL